MKQLIFMIMMIMYLSSCQLSDNFKTDVNQRPTLVINLEYMNDDKINSFFSEVKDVTLFVYNSEGKLFKECRVSADSLRLERNYIPLYGVPEDNYTVVAVTNLSEDSFIENKDEISKANIKVLDNQFITSIENILFCSDSFEVRRGTPPIELLSLDKKIIKTKLIVESGIGIDLDDFKQLSVLINNVSSGVSFHNGSILSDVCTLNPPLTLLNSEGIYFTSLFNMYDIENITNSTITLFVGERELVQISLDDIRNSNAYENIKNKRDKSLEIKLVVNHGKTDLFIEGWYIASFEDLNIGN